MIVIVDIGMGNTGSILNMFRKLRINATLSSEAAQIAAAERIIIPGVGAFDHGIRALRERNLCEPLAQAALVDHKPTLGICLGMQMLGRSSEEGVETGLGWIAASCRKFQPKPDSLGRADKVPHMGWNYLGDMKPHPLLAGADADTRFYFVHSYHVVCDQSEDEIASSWFGGAPFTAISGRGNIAGVQFHPEKSHRYGMRLLRNFSVWQP